MSTGAEGGWTWRPTREQIERANVTRLMRHHGIGSYRELIERSLADPSWYWEAVIEDLGIEFTRPYERVMDLDDGPAWPRWFVGGELNVAHQCLDRNVRIRPASIALRAEDEEGAVEQLTFAELRARSVAVAAALQSAGVGRGDRVALMMPMCVGAVTCFYGIAMLGAVAVPLFSGYSSEAIAGRVADVGAVAVAGGATTVRRGRRIVLRSTVDEAVAGLDLSPTVVEVARDGWPVGELAVDRDDVETVSVSSEDSLMVNYTSGTTGRPKGVVHVHGGLTIKVASEAAYLTDLNPGDALMWVSDMGWLMGPWAIIGAHAAGACLVVYEGAPDQPDAGRIWRVAEAQGVTHMGLSPTLVRATRSATDESAARAQLERVRIFASTGEPWDPSSYEWLGRALGGGRCPIINISGGTEVGACFFGQPPTLPTKTCSVGMQLPGMDIDVYDEAGRPVRGEVGELVCKSPWPAQARGFWRQPERYIETYWSRWDGVWAHGDWASIDKDGYWFLHGRSDDTLNVAGKRVGPAEIEAAVMQLPNVVDCAAIGVPDEIKGEAIWCFCVLDSDVPDLERLVAARVTEALGKAFAGVTVRVSTALPKTRSAKLMRRLIRARVLDEPPGDISALESPEALTAIDEALSQASR